MSSVLGKSPQQRKAEMLDRHINELHELQEYIMPGYNSKNIQSDSDKDSALINTKFLLYTLIVLALEFVINDLHALIFALAIIAVPAALVTFSLSLRLIDWGFDRLSRFFIKIFTLSVNIIMLVPPVLLAMLIKSLIKS